MEQNKQPITHDANYTVKVFLNEGDPDYCLYTFIDLYSDSAHHAQEQATEIFIKRFCAGEKDGNISAIASPIKKINP